MDTALLQLLYKTSHAIINHNVKGISHEESLIQPEPGGNCLNWVLGHIVASRNSIFRLLRNEPIWTADQASVYERGAPPLRGADTARPLPEILADLNHSQERLMARLATVTEAEMAAPSGMMDESVGGMIAFLQFHESYHAGQTGLLRRLIGREGAIK
jgi:uncharacterized damage-inducible protein DinB